MRRLRKGQKCEHTGCDEPAECLAAGRKGVVGVYCLNHALEVEDEDRPEYIVDCPNCGCGFGVN
jgi:hypothetical protein